LGSEVVSKPTGFFKHTLWLPITESFVNQGEIITKHP
ncbi:unnamed protein product, partial [marine sediment metagenome]